MTRRARLREGLAVVALLGVGGASGVAQEPDAQFERQVAGDGLVHLRWVAPVPPVTGQRLLARWTVLNPTGAPVAFEANPCDVEGRVEAAAGGMTLSGAEVACAAGARILEPGDSAWVQLSGSLVAAPGSRTLGAPFLSRPLEVRAGDGTGIALVPERFAGPGRIPVVLVLETSAGSPVTRGRIEALLDDAANGRGAVIVMDEEAARGQVETAPWLRIRMNETGGDTSAVEVNACWHRPEDGDAGCAAFRTRLPAANPETLLAPTGPLRRLLVTLLSLRDPVP